VSVGGGGGFLAGAEGCGGEVFSPPAVCTAKSCLRCFDGGGGRSTGPWWRAGEELAGEGVLASANDKERSAPWPEAMVLSLAWLRVRVVGSKVQSLKDALN